MNPIDEVRKLDAKRRTYTGKHKLIDSLDDTKNRWYLLSEAVREIKTLADKDFALCTYYKRLEDSQIDGTDHCSKCPLETDGECAEEVLIVREQLTNLEANFLKLMERLIDL